MSSKTAILVLLMMVSAASIAASKKKGAAESIQFQVKSTKTAIHGRTPNVFTYTQVMFVEVAGKRIVYSCDVRGDECPIMEAGKTYTADRAGDDIWFTMPVPDEKRPFEVRYKQIGTW